MEELPYAAPKEEEVGLARRTPAAAVAELMQLLPDYQEKRPLDWPGAAAATGGKLPAAKHVAAAALSGATTTKLTSAPSANKQSLASRPIDSKRMRQSPMNPTAEAVDILTQPCLDRLPSLC